MKKSLLITFIMIICITSAAFTATAQANQAINHTAEALTLQSLGLFSGTEKGFELNRAPTRVEGAIMLVRLLGKNNYALEQNFSHPFKDVPDWASPYIGYMYAANLTSGTGSSVFSPDVPLTPEQYLSFVLRSLGYNDQKGDFQWNQSIAKAFAIGLLDSSSRKELADFRRDQMVLVSYLCLGANLKDSNSTLLQKLVEEDRTVSPLQAESSGLYQPQPGTNQESIIVPAISESNNRFQVSNKDELTLALSAAMMKLKMEFIVDLHEYSGDILPDFESAVNGAIDLINQNTGIKDLLSQWQYSGTSQSLNIKMQYRYSNASLAQELVQNENVRDKVKEIVADIIKPGMTDYDKEKGLHDYIVNNSQYDYKNLLNNTIPKHSYSPYGILVLGRGVCQGYAESFALLCQEAGLECQVVTGEAYSFGQWSSHAWNIVKIDGINYHVDVTFDDPITDNETSVLNHNYFNLTDDQLAEDHKWERSAYPVCSGADI